MIRQARFALFHASWLVTGAAAVFASRLLDEHLRVKGRTKWYETVEEIEAHLDAYLEHYNRERPHQGRNMKGRRPYEAFVAGIAKEKTPKVKAGKERAQKVA